MIKNEELQRDVQNAIKWEPLLNAAEIGVTAKDGIVTLTGIVDQYAKKIEAENAAKNVNGVLAVVEKIEVAFDYVNKTSDNEIAMASLNALKDNWRIPKDNVKVEVEDGWVILEGILQWNYEKETAMKSIVNLLGVRGVSNNIKLISRSRDTVEKVAIENAFKRNSSIGNKHIQVEVKANNVILKGKVTSISQKEIAERVAWNAPGTCGVDNQLIVSL